MDESAYADDVGAIFCSRADLQAQAPALIRHYSRWGMEVHAGELGPTPAPPPLLAAAASATLVSAAAAAAAATEAH